MIFHLKQHSKEFKTFEEETEQYETENKKKNSARKLATLELGIGSKNSAPTGLKQPKVDEVFNKMSKYSLNGSMQTKFDNAVLELLAVNCLPFSLVESPEWKSLIELLDKRITVKSRRTYQRKMSKLAEKVLTRVKQMIREHCDVSFAITSDMWTSRSQDCFISGTFHFIDKKFRLHHWTPICEPVEERHTADVIQKHVDGMVAKLEVDDSVMKTCVSDNAANMLAGVRESCCKSYGCNCHWWQLAINDTFGAVPGMTRLLKKCKDIASYLHKSNVAYAELKAECKAVGHSHTAVNQSNDTRWDSQESCMSSILTHQTCLENLARRGVDRFPELVPICSEFILMKGACENLKKCKITTKIFEQETVPTINLVCDRIFTVVEELDTFINDRRNRGSGMMFAKELRQQIQFRFPEYATNREENCFANYLDPVLKGLHLKAVDKFEDTLNKLEALANEPEGNNNTEVQDYDVSAMEGAALTPREKLKRKILAREAFSQSSSGTTSQDKVSQFRKECASYEAMPDADNTTDRLQWWSHHSESFPILSKLARQILCIPAASSKSERTFSVGGNTVTSKRGSLGPFTVQDLITVACNLRLLKMMEKDDEDKEDSEGEDTVLDMEEDDE